MQVADTGFHPKGCHPSSPFGVIPVWNLGSVDKKYEKREKDGSLA